MVTIKMHKKSLKNTSTHETSKRWVVRSFGDVKLGRFFTLCFDKKKIRVEKRVSLSVFVNGSL